jgi:hypothetical protein
MAELKVKMSLGDIIKISIGLDNEDFLEEEHTVIFTLEEGSSTGRVARVGKIPNKQLETFALDILVSLGYKIKDDGTTKVS